MASTFLIAITRGKKTIGRAFPDREGAVAFLATEFRITRHAPDTEGFWKNLANITAVSTPKPVIWFAELDRVSYDVATLPHHQIMPVAAESETSDDSPASSTGARHA